jgi:hypothetical protein
MARNRFRNRCTVHPDVRDGFTQICSHIGIRLLTPRSSRDELLQGVEHRLLAFLRVRLTQFLIHTAEQDGDPCAVEEMLRRVMVYGLDTIALFGKGLSNDDRMIWPPPCFAACWCRR